MPDHELPAENGERRESDPNAGVIEGIKQVLGLRELAAALSGR